jgi:hypothetical protein
MKIGGNSAYFYAIAPRKSRADAIREQLWMDSDSDAEILLTGQLRKVSLIEPHSDVVCDTKVLKGPAYARFTHLNSAVRSWAAVS